MHFFGPFLYRSAFGAEHDEEERDRALAHLEQVILLEGPATIAALVLEPVTGSSGVIVPPAGYLSGVRDLCTRHGIMLIADEVLVGFGRTGAWFAVEHDGVAPDLLVFAKGVNSGYVPLGGVLVGRRGLPTFTERPYPAGMTYSGHPLACAAAVGAIGAMRDEGTVDAAAVWVSELLGPRTARARRRGTPASATCAASAASGPSSWSATGTPRSRSSRSGHRRRERADGGLHQGLPGSRRGPAGPRQPRARRAAAQHRRRATSSSRLSVLDEA